MTTESKLLDIAAEEQTPPQDAAVGDAMLVDTRINSHDVEVKVLSDEWTDDFESKWVCIGDIFDIVYEDAQELVEDTILTDTIYGEERMLDDITTVVRSVWNESVEGFHVEYQVKETGAEVLVIPFPEPIGAIELTTIITQDGEFVGDRLVDNSTYAPETLYQIITDELYYSRIYNKYRHSVKIGANDDSLDTHITIRETPNKLYHLIRRETSAKPPTTYVQTLEYPNQPTSYSAIDKITSPTEDTEDLVALILSLIIGIVIFFDSLILVSQTMPLLATALYTIPLLSVILVFTMFVFYPLAALFTITYRKLRCRYLRRTLDVEPLCRV